MSVYPELEAAVLPLMKHYQTDLLLHDRKAIEEHPEMPFLHWCSDSNTHLIFLEPPEAYPKEGVWIPYLFGQADRWHLVKSVTQMAEYFLNPYNMPERYQARYFNGRKMTVVSLQRALEIARDYRHGIEATFKQPLRLHVA